MSEALLGIGFLSEAARTNVKKTIEQKYASSKRSYDQTVSSYATGIDALTGRGNGSKFLSDYVTPEGSGSDLRSQVAAAGYDYAAMKADGLSDADIEAAISGSSGAQPTSSYNLLYGN